MTARYVLSVTPTEQGRQKYPAWQLLGNSINVYSREELDKRLAAAADARRAGDISAVHVRELTPAEQREAEQCRRLAVARQQRARAQDARGHGRER
ncbi:hypothetical protein AB0C34_17610 [Nocardia sp. NPDC049220]|uniref:hypothetical protein n=1 Tax=Nocardia sp. NPDC049220 TaxID=3155273 RepID=UPI0033F5CAD7